MKMNLESNVGEACAINPPSVILRACKNTTGSFTVFLFNFLFHHLYFVLLINLRIELFTGISQRSVGTKSSLSPYKKSSTSTSSSSYYSS